MMSSYDSAWVHRVRSAAGAELFAILEARLTRPYHEGLLLDDRRGEGPEEVFERLADDASFRERLEETSARGPIRAWLDRCASALQGGYGVHLRRAAAQAIAGRP